MDESTTQRIPLTQNKFAIVDAVDFDRVSRLKWMAMKHRGRFYAVRSIRSNGKKAIVMLHRFILNARPDMQVDHKDGDGLNCMRANLRVATHSQNMCNKGLQRNNTSGYKGVYWHKKHQKWCAAIRVNKRSVFLGLFHDPVDAAHAYDAAAIQYHGEFARLNFTP